MVVVSAATMQRQIRVDPACQFDKSLGPVAADKPLLYYEPGYFLGSARAFQTRIIAISVSRHPVPGSPI